MRRELSIGTNKHGGTPTSNGHLYAHGNTDEPFRIGILGVRRKGRYRDKAFDHQTGRGWVRGRIGKYADAVSKGARVVPLIIETTGSISPHSLKYISYLARRSRGKQARDGTKYGRSRARAPHHSSCTTRSGSRRLRRAATLTEFTTPFGASSSAWLRAPLRGRHKLPCKAPSV